MLYKEYEEYKTKYYEAQNKYDEILSEKETLFIKTQPAAVDTTKDVVSGGGTNNSFDTYLIAKEKKKIDERLEESRSILEDRERLLKLKKEELKLSKDWYDKVYYHKYIENLSVNEIKYKIPYCRSNIYEMLKKINKNISLDKNGQKS